MLQYAAGMLPVVLAFLLAPHLLLGIPVRSLVSLCLSVSFLLLALAPLFYFVGRRARRIGKWKLAFGVAGFAGEAMFLLLSYYAAKLEVLSVVVARRSVVAVSVFLPFAIVGAYYLDLKLFPEQFGRSKDSESP